jgi:hypothetical protein
LFTGEGYLSVRVHVLIPETAQETLNADAEHLGYTSDKHHGAPSFSAMLRAIAARQLLIIGPATLQEFTWLKDCLEVIAAHSSLFLNGLEGEDRQAALSFLERVRGEIAWQLGEGR